MKAKNYLLTIGILIFNQIYYLQAQGISVNSTGAPAHPSAILDVESGNKGLLIPRHTTASKLAIPNPARGLEVFDTTIWCISIYSGTGWIDICPQVTTYVCPPGSIDFGAFSVEVTLHAPTDYTTADLFCAHLGPRTRMCSLSELIEACDSIAFPNIGNDPEWVDDSPQENNMLIFGSLGCGGGILTGHMSANTAKFRCCCEH